MSKSQLKWVWTAMDHNQEQTVETSETEMGALLAKPSLFAESVDASGRSGGSPRAPRHGA